TVDGEADLVDALRVTPGREPDLVVLANVAPRAEAAAALAAFVRAGGALLVFVGDNPRFADPAALNDIFYADPRTRLLPFPVEAPEVRTPGPERAPFTIDLEADTGHPLARPFTGPEAQGWIGLMPPAIWGRIPFRESTDTGTSEGGEDATAAGRAAPGHVVLRFKDGRSTPAVVQGGLGAGKTLWVGTSLGAGWFERALPFFLPVFLDEAAVYLTRPDDTRRNLEVGQRIVVSWLAQDVRGVRFTAPDGRRLAPTRYDGPGALDRPTFVLDRIGTAGIWRLEYEHAAFGATGPTKEETFFAVNPAPVEGRLARAKEDAIRRSVSAEGDLAIVSSWAEETGPGKSKNAAGEVAGLLLWIVLGLLLLESVLGWLFGRRGSPAPPRGAVPASREGAS
ncbi:MAG: hypothetical protein ACC662_11610, partial [Planctomycetota bacterium]